MRHFLNWRQSLWTPIKTFKKTEVTEKQWIGAVLRHKRLELVLVQSWHDVKKHACSAQVIFPPPKRKTSFWFEIQ